MRKNRFRVMIMMMMKIRMMMMTLMMVMMKIRIIMITMRIQDWREGREWGGNPPEGMSTTTLVTVCVLRSYPSFSFNVLLCL